MAQWATFPRGDMTDPKLPAHKELGKNSSLCQNDLCLSLARSGASTAQGAQRKAAWTKPAWLACVSKARTTFPTPLASLPALLAAGDKRAERYKADSCQAFESSWPRGRDVCGRPGWSLAAQLLFAGQGCTLGVPVPPSRWLGRHSPLLGDPHILIDMAGIVNTFQLCLPQLLEEVTGQARGCVGGFITGHQPRVVHHQAGSQIHLMANHCHRERTH